MPDLTHTQPTTVRFHPDELELIDAWCAYYSKNRGFKHSRSNMLRSLLARVQPPAEKPDEPPEAHRLRRAHSIVFGKHQEAN